MLNEENKRATVQSNVTALPMKDEAFKEIERLIVNGQLEPGTWVSETDMIDASGHTRASVRSAIQRLADYGLLSIAPRRGAQVCPISHTEQFRALELRRVVETLVARTAAKRATDAQRQRLMEISDLFKAVAASPDQDVMTELDAECFSLLISASDNRFAARALTSVKGLSRRFWVLHRERYGDSPRIANAYATLAKSVAGGNPSEASDAANCLIDYVEEFTLEVVGFSQTKS